MKNRLILYSILCLLTSALLAAEPDSINYESSVNSLQLFPVLNPFLQSSNPAGLALNPDLNVASASFNYKKVKGDYKKAMQGDRSRSYAIFTEGYKKQGKSSFYGSFSYDKSLEDSVNYSEVNNPYRESPYLLLDSAGVNDIYDREFFTLHGAMATPLFNHLYWGFSANMNTGLAVQDRDPRSENKVLNIDLSKGLLLSYPGISIGLNALYSYYNEEIEVDVIEKHAHYDFLHVYALNKFTDWEADSYNKLYKRHTAGGELQFRFQNAVFTSLLGGKFLYLRESIDDGRKLGNASWNSILNYSELKGNKFKLFSINSLHLNSQIHRLEIAYNNSWYIGSEFKEALENIGELKVDQWIFYWLEEKLAIQYNNLDINYNFILLKDKFSKNIDISLGCRLYGKQQAYYLPDMNEEFRNLRFSASLDKSFFLNKQELAIGAGLQYKKNIKASRNYDESSPISRFILNNDYNYMSSNYVAYSADATYARDLNSIFDKIFVNASYNYYTSGDLYRSCLTFKTGVIF